MSRKRHIGLVTGLVGAAFMGGLFLFSESAKADHEPHAGTMTYQYLSGTDGLRIVVYGRDDAVFGDDTNSGVLGTADFTKVDAPADLPLVDGYQANQLRHNPTGSTWYMGQMRLSNRNTGETETYLIEVQGNQVVNWYGTNNYYIGRVNDTSVETHYCGNRDSETGDNQTILINTDSRVGNPCQGWLNLTNQGPLYKYSGQVSDTIESSSTPVNLFYGEPRRDDAHAWLDHKVTMLRIIRGGDSRTIHAAVDSTNIDQNKQIVGAKLCQAREKLLALVRALPADGQNHDLYWNVGAAFDTAELGDIGNTGVLYAAVQFFAPGTAAYSAMKGPGQTLYNQATLEIKQAEEAYSNLAQAAQNGTINGDDLNIRSCESTGRPLEIDKLSDLQRLINRAKVEAEKVKQLPTNFSDDPCKCSDNVAEWTKKYNSSVAAAINLAICTSICAISQGLGKFACVIIEKIIDPLFKKSTEPRTCGGRGAFIGPTNISGSLQAATDTPDALGRISFLQQERIYAADKKVSRIRT